MNPDERVLEFIDDSIQKIIDNPRLFGYLSAELQVLRLLEARQAICYPDRIDETAGALVDRFYTFMNEEHTAGDEVRLYVRLGYNVERWQGFLRRFAATIRIESIQWPPRFVDHNDKKLRIVKK